MKKDKLQIVRVRNRRKRLVGWAAFYACLVASFLGLVMWQSRRVNTLDFQPGKLQISVSKTKYNLGETVNYTVTNKLGSPVTLINDCPQEPLHVYEWKNSSWIRVHSTADVGVCVNLPKQTILPTNGSITGNYANWPNLFDHAGIYRLVALANNYTELPYADFQVIAPTKSTVQIQTQTQIIYQPVYTPVYITVPAPGGGGGGDRGGD